MIHVVCSVSLNRHPLRLASGHAGSPGTAQACWVEWALCDPALILLTSPSASSSSFPFASCIYACNTMLSKHVHKLAKSFLDIEAVVDNDDGDMDDDMMGELGMPISLHTNT